MNIDIFKESMSHYCYLLEYTELSNGLTSVLVRGNDLLEMLTAGVNKYQFFPSFTMVEKLCKIRMCLQSVPHFTPSSGKTFQHKAAAKKCTFVPIL